MRHARANVGATSGPLRHPRYALFEAFQPSLLRTKLVTNVLHLDLPLGSGRFDQFAFKPGYSISHLLSFSLPYVSNPAWTTHIQRSPSMQHRGALEN